MFLSYIDIAIIAIILVFAVIGMVKGFFKTILAFFGTVVSLIITFLLTRWLAGKLLEIGAIYGFVYGGSGIKSWLMNLLPDFGGLTVGSEQALIESALEGNVLKVFTPLISSFLEKLTITSAYDGISIQECVATVFATGIFYVTIGIILFVLLKVIIMIITAVINVFHKSRVIKNFDRLLGFLVGGAQGAIVVVLILAVMSFFMGSAMFASVRTEIDTHSIIAKPVSSWTSTMMEKYIDLNKMTGGLIPKEIEPHETTVYEEEAAAAIEVFVNSDAFKAEGKYNIDGFTADAYGEEAAGKMIALKTTSETIAAKIRAGEYGDLEISEVLDKASVIKTAYEVDLFNALETYEVAGDKGAALADVVTAMNNISALYSSSFADLLE